MNTAIPFALDLLERAKKINRFALMGKRPRSVLVGAIYLASVLMRISIRPIDLAYFSGFSEVTVKNRYMQLAELLNGESPAVLVGKLLGAELLKKESE